MDGISPNNPILKVAKLQEELVGALVTLSPIIATFLACLEMGKESLKLKLS